MKVAVRKSPQVHAGGVRCYFSGIESPQHFQQCVSAKVGYVLTSFWQFHDKGTLGLLKQRKLENPQMKFMVDSGAHTFITSSEKFTSWSAKDFEDYVRKYTDWLRQNRAYIEAAVEFDIDYTLNTILGGSEKSSVGTATVERWQKQYFRPLQELGLDIIYVWHEPRGIEGWVDMCSQFDYVGLPGALSAKPDFNKYIGVARRYTTRIHGFAATKQLDFRDVPWFSIDSITWKTGEMYGTLILWDPRAQKLTFEDDKARRFQWRSLIEASGLFNVDDILQDRNYREVTRFSLWSMRQMEKFYADKYASRFFYYQLRLPPWRVLQTASSEWMESMWKLFRPVSLFAKHQHAHNEDLRSVLMALSAVQFGDTAYLNSTPAALNFLADYFPKLVNPLTPDIKTLQAELSYYISPPNPPPQERTDESHLVPNDNAPRVRTELLEDEEFDFDQHPWAHVEV